MTVFRVIKFEGAKSLSAYRQKLYGFFTHETFERNAANCGRKSNCVSYTVRGAKCTNEKGTCKNMSLEHY